MTLAVEFDGQERSHKTFKVQPASQVDISMHLHMLTPGTGAVRFTLANAKSNLDSIEVPLTVPEKNSKLGRQVTDLLKKHKTPAIIAEPCDSSMYPYADTTSVAWFDHPDAELKIEELVRSHQINDDEATQFRQFVSDGYMVFEDLIDDDMLAKVNAAVDDAVAQKFGGYVYGTSARIEHLHLHYESVRTLWLDNRILRLASLIFGDRAVPCQTLTFVFGSQQDPHQDTIHLTPFPAGYMCGVWVALQDVQNGSGELVVYPGSHREQRVYMNDADCPKVKGGDWSIFGQKFVPKWAEMTKKYEPMIYRPKRGTVLMWHENLLHGGSARINRELERRSIVVHCFAEGSVMYYDSTGMPGVIASINS